MDKQNKIIGGLTLISLICLVAAYFAPIWWVSLTAPNSPPDAFPDGIRIHFHFDGVYNGCKVAGKGSRMANEIIQKDLEATDERYNPITDAAKNVDKGAEGLDCVHEMNTINHYVGMFPIATGAGRKAAGQVLLRLLRRDDACLHNGQEKTTFNRVDRRIRGRCYVDAG